MTLEQLRPAILHLDVTNAKVGTCVSCAMCALRQASACAVKRTAPALTHALRQQLDGCVHTSVSRGATVTLLSSACGCFC